MILTESAHTISKKGGGCRIQLIFELTKQPTLADISIIWFYKMRGIINSSGTVNQSTTLDPEKCIMHFSELRTRSANLHLENDNSFHQLERGVRVEKSTHNTQRR